MHDDDQPGPSKSAAKRAAEQVRQLAEALVADRRDDWRDLIDEVELTESIELARRLTKNARRRQVSRIAKLLRQRPGVTDALSRRAESMRLDAERNRQHLSLVENLRRKFVAGDDAAEQRLRDLADDAAWQALHELRSDYHSARADRDRKTAYRALFRRLDALLAAR